MATGDKLVTLDDLKVAYDKLKAEDGALRQAIREVEWYDPEETASGSQSGMDYSRIGNRVTLTGDIGRFITIRMYGDASSGTSSYDYTNKNPGCITLQPGHTYAIACRQISGTTTVGGTGRLEVALRIAGGSTAITTDCPSILLKPWHNLAEWSYREFVVPADSQSTTVGVWLGITNRFTATSATFEIELFDVTGYNPFNDEAIAPSECVVAKANRSVGDLILVGGQLFKVTSAIAAGETIATTDISATSVAEEIAALNT